MKVTEIEKLNQLISRTDMNGNQKVDWLINFIDEHVAEQLRLNDVSNRRELLCAFFKYFRDNGEANIGMTIEEFVDGFLSTQ